MGLAGAAGLAGVFATGLGHVALLYHAVEKNICQ